MVQGSTFGRSQIRISFQKLIIWTETLNGYLQSTGKCMDGSLKLPHLLPHPLQFITHHRDRPKGTGTSGHLGQPNFACFIKLFL
jgi:hypothetical protein